MTKAQLTELSLPGRSGSTERSPDVPRHREVAKDEALRKLYTRISEILLREWDPIGVADIHTAQDEYDSYVGEIASAVRSRVPASVIAERLLAIETERMALSGDRDRALRVATSLLHSRSG
jgi:hypothetical protein